jgi:hypothetical protein
MLTDRGFKPSDPELRARGMPCVLLKRLEPHGPNVVPVDGRDWDIRLIDSMHG